VETDADESLKYDKLLLAKGRPVRRIPVPGATFGSSANALSMPDPNTVLVSLGRDNAIAVYKYTGLYNHLQYRGLIPTDGYPVQVQPDSALGAGDIVVTNDRGIGDRGPQATINKGPDTNPATGYNTYDDTGTVTTFAMPGYAQLPGLTQTVFTDNDWAQIKPIGQGYYDSVPTVIPRHRGGASQINHIVVIARENRTSDPDRHRLKPDQTIRARQPAAGGAEPATGQALRGSSSIWHRAVVFPVTTLNEWLRRPRPIQTGLLHRFVGTVPRHQRRGSPGATGRVHRGEVCERRRRRRVAVSQGMDGRGDLG